MKVAILGAGGIGATIGARLAATGHEVVLVARGAHLAALQKDGLTLVDHLAGGRATWRLPASDEAAAFGVQDVVIVGLKAYSLVTVLPRAGALIGPETVVVPAINGLPWWYFQRTTGPLAGRRIRALDADGTLARALDATHLLGCVVHIAAEVRAPGQVHWTGGRRLILGELDHPDSARLQSLCLALCGAGFEAIAATDIRQDVWTKLIGNLSFNPVAALTGYRIDQICADEAVLELIRAMMREGMAVSAHFGHPLPMTPDQRIDLARLLGPARISMLQDLEQRRPLELDAIVGAVIELAELAGIEVPTLRYIRALTVARARTLGIAV